MTTIKINKTSKFKRLYGMSVSHLAFKLNVTNQNVYQKHTKGELKYLEIDDCEKVFKKINSKIIHLFHNINRRCNNEKDKKFKWYGGKGIQNFLTLKDLIYLWERDGADNLKQASIDRIDENKSYSLDNCRFIEMEENATRPKFISSNA